MPDCFQGTCRRGGGPQAHLLLHLWGTDTYVCFQWLYALSYLPTSLPTLGTVGLFSLLPVAGGDRVAHRVQTVFSVQDHC